MLICNHEGVYNNVKYVEWWVSKKTKNDTKLALQVALTEEVQITLFKWV